MNQQRVTIFDVSFYSGSKQHFLSILFEQFSSLKHVQIVTANPEILMKTKKNRSYATLLQRVNWVVPDGIGVVVASRILSRSIRERITGFDLLISFLFYANEHRLSVAFVGTTTVRIEKARVWIEQHYPHIRLYTHHGYYDPAEEKRIVHEISSFQPDFLFVGTGAPAQDFFVESSKSSVSFKVGMGIGGCLDVFSGEVQRAPLFWQKLHIEWLYRMLQEPKRWLRFGQLPLFLLHVLVDKCTKKV